MEPLPLVTTISFEVPVKVPLVSVFPVVLPMRSWPSVYVVCPVPPFATAKVPEVIFEPLRLVSPDPLPVKVFEPILMFPKPLPIEPEVNAPTEARLEAEVRPASVVIFGNDVVADRTAIAVVEARVFVKYRLFDPSDKALVVVPARLEAN